jgi:hypothetical protein
MRKATRIIAAFFGIIAGILGLEHGIFEILQGNNKPLTLMFAAMGPPCIPEKIWNACEPAMTLLPNFLLTGILTVIICIPIVTWSAVFVHGKNGGIVLIVLSVILLLVGGGFFPPLIGLFGGTAGTMINKPRGGKSTGIVFRFGAMLWPWPLVIFIAWMPAQFLMGTFFNDFLMSIMGIVLLIILISLPLSVFAGYAHDAGERADALSHSP